MTDTAKAIEKIHEFERFGSILGLERMTGLLEILGNPHEDLKVIHVAGTNGKGSTCRYMYSVLQEAGYKTGLYTSPFLEKFNERIELDGEMISDEDLAYYTDVVLKAVKTMTDRGLQSPTEFEVVTAIAFVYYKEKQCDYVILEVGLGGTGDSTNVCSKPLVSVIASVSMDHMDRLGNTIEMIAAEKAGIIKKGCPVVTSVKDAKALAVIEEKARELGCKFIATNNLNVTITKESLAGSVFDAPKFDGVTISMNGRHQVENACLALTTLNLLRIEGKIKLFDSDIYNGLKKAKQPGRFEVMSEIDEKPVIIIDGAHNEDGAKALAETMINLCQGKKTLMVTGMLKDKDVSAIIDSFMKITDDFVITEPDNPRKMDAVQLAELFMDRGAKCQVKSNPEEACSIALSKKDEYDVIVFAGSLYLIGKIRSILRNVEI